MVIENPEFHWCYAQTYFLVGKTLESLDHYRKYKKQILINKTIHPLFQKPVNELETALENQQLNLAYDIYMKISKIILWGHKLHSHTHSYIHNAYVVAFKYLGFDTFWFDDKDDVSKFDFTNSLFITEHQVDNHIPKRDDCLYFVQIAIYRCQYNLKNLSNVPYCEYYQLRIQ